MSNLEKFLEEVHTNLQEVLGDLESNALPYATEEVSWIIWNKKRLREVCNTQHWAFMPSKKDYCLGISILGETLVGLQYLEVFEEGKGTGTKILNCVLDAADKYGITIDVFASPFKTKYGNLPWYNLTRSQLAHMTNDIYRLINWYRDFNFVSTSKKEPFRLQYKVA